MRTNWFIRLLALSWVSLLAFTASAVVGVSSDVVNAPPAHAVGAFDNAVIANVAESMSGYGGQCKEFVNNVVRKATGISLSGYHEGYRLAGGKEVSSTEASRGDIIQIGNSNYDWPLHSAIILQNRGNDNFWVRESNWTPNTIGSRLFNPYAWVTSKGASRAVVKIWRLGTVAPPPPTEPDLYFIKTKGGIGHVEVHSATRATNYQGSSIDSIVNLPVGNVPNGVVKMADMNNDGRADLVYIKTGGGVSRVELHWWNAATGFGGGGDVLTRFSAADGANGIWDVLDGDLYFIKTKGGIGHVEVHSATRASNYQSSSVDRVSNFPVSDVPSGLFRVAHMDGDNRADLVYIKTNVGAGRVEMHWRNAAAGFIAGGDSTTAFSGSDALYGSWDVSGGNLYYIKTGGGTGRVEIHMVTRASGFQSSGMDFATRFTMSDGPYGLWQMGR